MSTTPEANDAREPIDGHRPREPIDGHRRRLAREKEAFGGMKLGSGFFGWLAATGTAALLLVITAAAGVGAGAARSTSVEDAADQASQDLESLATVGGIVLLVILFIAYFCGGYVAGRMARLDGVKQGLAVWLWAVVVAVVVGVLAAVAGDRFDIGAQLETVGLPIATDDLTLTGVIALLVIAVITLVAAILGGRAGMHYHRKVDRAGQPDGV